VVPELIQVLQSLVVLVFAPLYSGVLARAEGVVASKRGPSVLQPYRDLAKLLRKGSAVSDQASWVFRGAPFARRCENDLPPPWPHPYQIIRCGCPIHAAGTTWLGHSRHIRGVDRAGGHGSRVTGVCCCLPRRFPHPEPRADSPAWATSMSWL
jgi:hypothetical protein